MKRLGLMVGGILTGFALGHYFNGDERFLFLVGGFGLGFLTCAIVVMYDLGRRRLP